VSAVDKLYLEKSALCWFESAR